MKGIYIVAYDQKTSDISAKYPYSVYYADKTSAFFENEYIRDLVNKGAHNDDDFFAVLSPHFFTKAIGGRLTPHKIQHDIERGIQIQTGRNTFEKHDVDAIGFTPQLRNTNVITQGDRTHVEGFSDLVQEIFNLAGVNWNVLTPLKKIVMSNYIIARSSIWQHYADTVLLPCMEVMETDKAISNEVWKDSRYYKKAKMSAKLKQDLGVSYYPLHTFICERFWSVYLAMNPDVNFRHFGK